MTEDRQSAPNSTAFSVKKWWPLGLLLAGLAAFFALDLNAYLSFEVLRENRIFLREWTAANTGLALLVYAAMYIAAVAFSLPGATIMTISGGFLFGPAVATPVIVISATIGATMLFLAARTALGDLLRAKAGPALRKMETGFRKNELSYMFALRLVPLFPFFVVNLAPAFLGVSLRNFIIATLFGIIPGVLVYSSVGNGLGVVFDAGGTPDFGIIFKPAILFPILGLALMALLPVVYERIRGAGS